MESSNGNVNVNEQLTADYAAFTESLLDLMMTALPIFMTVAILPLVLRLLVEILRNSTTWEEKDKPKEQPVTEAVDEEVEKAVEAEIENEPLEEQPSFIEQWLERVMPSQETFSRIDSILQLNELLEANVSKLDTVNAHLLTTLEKDFEQLLVAYEGITVKERERFDDELVEGLGKIQMKLETIQQTLETEKEMMFSKQLLVIEER